MITKVYSREIKKELSMYADSAKAKLLSGFFKTGKGQYGEGDRFMGITVPVQRLIAKKYKDASLHEVEILLHDSHHEVRLTGLLILTYKLKGTGEDIHKSIFDFYLENTRYINNWDLVDVTARDIIGGYLFKYKKDRGILYRLAGSNNIWERRIAIISTFYFIANNDFSDALKISEMLLNDEHDLIHKAVGWMLREVGKRDKPTLISFLEKFSQIMPRTMLRYSVERLSVLEKAKYMKMKQRCVIAD